MRLKVILGLALLAVMPSAALAQLASPFSNSVWPAQTFTATGQTGNTLQLNVLTVSSTVGSSFASGTLTLTGTSLTTVTFSVMGSSDNGGTFYALPIYTQASPSTSPSTTITATANGLYQVSLAGITHVKIVTSGTFTATAVSIVFTASPNVSIAKNGGSGSAPSGSAGLVYATPPGTSGSASLQQLTPAYLVNAVTQQVLYASKTTGVTGGQSIAPGSSATGAVDSAGVLNTALALGNVKLVLDSAVALSTSLVLYSGDTIECPSKNYGAIMMTGSNAPVVHNAHQNAPTTTSGTGGYLVSNQTDQNITVRGCMLNANSTQAVTGSNVLGTPHAVNPGTGLFVFGMDFDGVNNLALEGNELYDTGAFSINFSNDSHILINGNYVHQPTPVVAEKNTDGPHFIGPDQYIVETNNTIIAGDDALPLNADDGNRTGSGDPNAPYIPTYVRWGWITDATLANNNINGSSFGLRMYAATELLDRIFISNTTGHICGNTAELTALSALGSGNIGTVRIDGWGVWTDGTCNSYGQPYNFIITQNYKAIQISGLQIQPTIYWPVITHNVTSPGVLSLRDWDVYSPSSSSFNLINLTGGAAPQVALSGLQWLDNASNTGSVFGGSVVPATLTCSNYSGPNRLLASGFSPSHQNGDCFTNTYSTAVTYINTIFNEHASGNLAGTTPATVASPATGGWTLASGTDFTYTGSSSVTSATSQAVPDLMSVGTTNYTLRVTIGACGGTCGLAARYVNINNFLAINAATGLCGGAGGFAVYDVVSGTATQLGSSVCGTLTGTYTIVFSGSSVSITGPAGTTSVTTANTTGTSVGFVNDLNATMTLTAFSAKSF